MLIVMTPVTGLPLKVPVKPGAAAVKVVTEPLSVGALAGVTLLPAPVVAVAAG